MNTNTIRRNSAADRPNVLSMYRVTYTDPHTGEPNSAAFYECDYDSAERKFNREVRGATNVHIKFVAAKYNPPHPELQA